MKTMNISITETMREWIDARVKSGVYANASDYMRELIRTDQTDREWLMRTLIEADEGGVSERTFEEIIAEAKKELKNGGL